MGERIEGWMVFTRNTTKGLWHGGFDNKAFVDLNIYVDDARGNTTPYLATCSDNARLLHFNGLLKPWTFEVWRDLQAGPVCAMPESYEVPNPSWRKWATIWARKQPFVRCHDLWSMHISEELDCTLKD